jgi:tRNA A37 threonylcarbamoyladenosine biosynthesis protein TsaE
VLIVEWGDAVDELLPDDRLRVELTSEDPAGGSDARRIAITAEGPSWVERADELAAATGPWSADR